MSISVCILYKPLLVVYKLYHYFKSIYFLNHITLRVLVQNFSYIAYFIKSHKVLYNQTAKYQQVFAFVQWYQHHPSQHDVVTSRMEAWCANLFEPFGPASFLPAQRIQSQFVAAFNSMTDEEVLYVCPIPQKTFI